MIGNVLALDIGGKRIGLAIAKAETNNLARPMGTIEANEAVLTKIQDIVKDNAINTVVVGLPRNLNGEETAQTATVREFVNELQPYIASKIQLIDEALTSVKAEEELKSRGKPYQKEDIDSLAATLFLEDFLNAR